MLAVLVRLRLTYLRRKAARKVGNLRVYFDFWATVHYVFVLAVFGPAVWQWWRNPPPLPASGQALLSLWPLAALTLGWVWAVGSGIFGPVAKSPLFLSEPDARLLLPSPLPRPVLFAERMATAWVQRTFVPVQIVLLLAVLTAQYHAVDWGDVGVLIGVFALLALGATGLAVAVWALGPGFRRGLAVARSAGQGVALVLAVAAMGVGRAMGPSVATGFPTGAVALHLGGALWPALLFALAATAAGWALAVRQEMALWTDRESHAAAGRTGRTAPTPARPSPRGAFRWKLRAVLVKRPVWEWISRAALPVLAAGLTGLLVRGAASFAALGSALVLFEAARYIGRSAMDDLEHPERIRRLPVSFRQFVEGNALELFLWLLGPSLFVWLMWGAGWAALAGGPATAALLAALVLQNGWSGYLTRLSAGTVGPSDAAFAHALIIALVLIGHAVVAYTRWPLLMLAVLSGLVLAGAVILLQKVYWDLIAYNIT